MLASLAFGRAVLPVYGPSFFARKAKNEGQIAAAGK
jgi:hypothetical protein